MQSCRMWAEQLTPAHPFSRWSGPSHIWSLIMYNTTDCTVSNIISPFIVEEMFSPMWCSGKDLVANTQSTDSHCEIRKWQIYTSVELLVHMSVVRENAVYLLVMLFHWYIDKPLAYWYVSLMVQYIQAQYSISSWNPCPSIILVGHKSWTVSPTIRLSRIFAHAGLHFCTFISESILGCPELCTYTAKWLLSKWSHKFDVPPW